MAWYIRYGMGGGYGGAGDWEETDATSEEEAFEWAHEAACEFFEGSGEFDYEQFYEDNPDADAVDEWEAYSQELDSWIDYGVEWRDE